MDIHKFDFLRGISKFYAKEQYPLTEKLAIGGRVSFSWIMQSLAPSVWSQLICLGIVQGIYTPSKKMSLFLSDIINYRPLHSPYDTQYCAIFTERS